ncbi:MAG: hypothetical protein KA764_06975 [Anaerolineales bacterium]|nr:hypothetical protein [Anaerolineales bacterium]
MPFYPDEITLYGSLREVFTRLETTPEAYRALTTARLALRLKCTAPAAEVLLDGRRPGQFQAHYGPALVRPDLDVELATDTLHLILLDSLPLKKAVGSGLVKVKGPTWKLSALATVLDAGRLIYPEVLREQNLM